MPLDPALLAAFLVVATMVALSPGPDALFVVANGLQHRRKGAIASAVGICSGTILHTLAAALGVSAVLMASPVAFDVLRFGGVFYLIILGLRAIVSKIGKSSDTEVVSVGLVESVGPSAMNIFYRGLVTNLLIPRSSFSIWHCCLNSSIFNWVRWDSRSFYSVASIV